MVKFISYKEKLYRVLLECEAGTWVSSWDSVSAPIRIGDTSDFSPEKIPSEFIDEVSTGSKREARMESRLDMIRPLLEEPIYIQDASLRAVKMREIANEHGVSEKTIQRYYFAYLARGQNGLLPKKRKPSAKEMIISDIDRDMQKAVNKYYYSPRKLSLREAYEMYLLEYWEGDNGKLREGYPDFSKFERNYAKVKNDYRKVISRQGIGNYQKEYRPLLGSSGAYAKNCGMFAMDATVADICIVSKYSRKPIGRPLIYLAVDMATKLITGVYVGLNGGSNAILQCMANMVEDKVKFCKKHGVEISRHQWPSIGLPKSIITDRGTDFTSGRVKEICERFDIELTNLPAYRPDLKGDVEKAFDCLQERYKPMLKGYGTIELERTREGISPVQTKACLDLSEYTKILIRCIIYYNSARVLGFQREPQMTADGVEPVASRMWEWMVKNGRADLIEADSEDIHLMLLPREKAVITRQGLLFNGLRYVSSEIDMTREYVEAGINGRKKVTVAYKEDSVNTVFLIEGGRYFRFDISSASEHFRDVSFDEIKLLREEERFIRRRAEHIRAQEAAMCADFIQDVAVKAEKTKPHTKKDIETRQMKKEREREKKNSADN